MKNFNKNYTVLFIFLYCFIPNLSLSQCGIGQTLNTYCYDNGEVNNIAFEICPTAGNAIESNIIQGSFFTNFNDNLTVYSGISGSGLSGTIVFGPISGNVAGNTISSLGANQCLIFVINSNIFNIELSCADGTELELQVCSQNITASAVSFSAPADLCLNAGIQTGLGGGVPVGGVYSGPGVTDDGNGTTYSFDPLAAGVGVHTLTYTNGGSASDDVEVFALGSISFSAPADLCIDAGIQTGLGGGSPSGGVYAGSGVTDDGNGTSYSFNPAIAGLGVHTITYTVSGICINVATDDIEVLAACGCPAPQSSHFHCSAAGETNLVIFEICPTADELAQATINAGTYSTTGNNLTVYQGASGSGTGGTILYGPQTGNLTGNIITATAIDQCLIFVSNTIVGGCQEGLETALEVCGESLNNPVFFTAPGDLCINDGIQTGLTGGIPEGGVYSGSGVTDDGNGMTYSFDPAIAGVGVHTLTYTLGGSSISDDIEVFAVPVVSFTALPDLCIDAGNQTGLVGGTPIGGVYSGPGVTDNGNGMTYTFNPLTAGLGTHTITYTEGGICMETATDVVEVTAACSCPAGEVTYFNCYDNNENDLVIFEVCPTAGQFSQADISQGTYGAPDDNLTVYQGASGSGTGGTIVYGPINGNLAGNTIISTLADECLIFVSNSGPIGSCSDGFESPLIVCGSSLVSNITVTFTALPDLSVNAGIQTGVSGGSPMGGVYSGSGVTDDGNGMTYTFNPAAAGVGVHTLTYTLGGNSASDDVEVLNLLPPGFSKSFNNNQIGPGSVSTLTFTIDNTSSGSPATDLAFTDNLPAGMTIASPPAISSSCTGATISATAGGTSITVSDGSVAPGASCTISVNVTSSTVGTHTNTTGDLTSSSGNSGTASANLDVLINRPGFSKSFSPSSVNLGERTTLTFTIDNTGNAVAHSNLTFTDNLPVGMVVANPSNATIGCNGGLVTAVPGSNVISYTGTIFTDASVPAGGTCTISIDVIGGTVGQLDNVTGDLTSFNNFFQNFNSGKASASLEILPPADIHIQKSFTTNPVAPGGTTNLEFTITNFNRDFPATNISFTDDLTNVLAGLTATGTPLNDICGTGSQLSGTTMLTFTGGTIPPEGSCTFTVPVQIPASAALGTYINVTSSITADINGSTITGNPATENLFIQNLPTFTKTFLTDPIPAGGTTTLEFTITNTSATSALTDITFSDVIDDFINGSTLSNLPAAGSCGAGSIFLSTLVGGKVTFQMTGGNIAAGGSCTFSIDLTIPTNTGAGTYTNTTSFLSGVVDGQAIQANPATDDLEVLAVPTLSKSFTDDPVNTGDIVNLEFTITYDEFATGDATSISFTDDLNAVIPGLAAVGLPLNDICGTGASISGTTNLTFTGGTLSPGGSCTFSVPVQVPTGIAPGSYTNTTSALTATVGGQAATGDAATDDLEIGGITFTKEFLDDEVLPGETTTLRFTIDNTSSFDATGIFFSDNLSSVIPGMAAQTPLPTAPCGASSITTGTTNFIFFNGEINAGTSCSFDIDVLVPASAANGTYTNVTSNLSATIDGVARTLPPAIDDITVNSNLISLTKTFTDDPVAPGGTVTVEYTLTNLDATNAISNIAFTDDFDGALTGLAATGLPINDICGTGSTISGTGLLSFTGGNLAAGASCTFSVTLQTPASTPYGTVVNCPTSGVTGEIGGLPVIGDAANDDLQFQSLELSKSIAGPVTPGETTIITFIITNNDPLNSLSQISFTDDLDAFISGMEATVLPPVGTCGSLSEVTGTSLINFGRGELGPSQSCSFDVTVLVPCGTAANTYTNTTSTITADGVNGSIEAPAATNTLVVSASNSAAFTAPNDLCFDAGVQAGLSSGTPTGGVYSGTGVTDDGDGMTYSFDPAAAGVGTHTLTYTFTDINNCITNADDDVEIFALPMVTFIAPADLCLNAGVQTGLGSGTPTGGVYSGTGVTDDGNGMTFSFDPAVAGVGTHTITYTFTNGNGCTASASDDVEVFAIPTAVFTAPADLCLNAGVQIGLGGGTPTGGVYSGTGVTDDGNGMTYSFDPAAAGVGTHAITYTVGASGCFDSASDMVEVFALPVVTLTIPANQDEFCLNDPTTAISLAGNPTGLGGIYSGSGVVDLGNAGITFTFDPAAAGVGTHTVTYTFTDVNGCTNSATDDITVNALPTVSFTALPDLCLDAGVQTSLTGGSMIGGVYSGIGVTDDANGMTYSFDPAAAGVGTHSLTYSLTDGNGCTGSASDNVQVFALPTVTFTAPADLCIDAGVQTGLGGGMPTGGVYSGTGITDDGNGMTYSFDPATAGVGVLTITYAVGVSGCTDSASDDVEVFTLPTISFTAPPDFCIDAGIQLGMGQTTTPEGGVFSGPGVMDDANGDSFTFNPAIAGVGVHVLTYTFTDANGCTASATDNIEIFALPIVTFTALPDLCLNAGVQTGISGGTPIGGVYSGTGVTDDANGMTFSFDPAVAGVGTHSLTYTFTDANGCTNSASDDIEVFALPVVMFTAPVDLCIDAGVQAALGGGSQTGGVYSGPGVTDDANGMTFSFDPAAAGVGTHSLTYNFTDGNGCTNSASDNIEVFDLPTVTLAIPANQNEFCIDDPTIVISLAGAPTGGLYSGLGVTDLGTGDSFTFNPATAGVGTHTVTYSITDVNGCSASATDNITVNTLPMVTFTAPADLCFDAGVQTGLGGGTPPQGTEPGDMGIYSGAGVTDDGNGMTFSFDPVAAGVGVHTLTYTYTNESGCTNSADDDIEVFALPIVTFTAPVLDVCVADPTVTGLGGGTPTGGVYSGIGVTDDANGMTFSFDPTASALAGGNIPVTYTFTDANGCSNSTSGDIFVNPICCDPPTITCPPDNFGLPVGCNPTVPVGTITFNIAGGSTPDPALPTVSDGCDPLDLTFTDAIADVGCMRTVTRTYRITDDNGDFDECDQVFTFTVDTDPPAVTCADFTITLDGCPAGLGPNTPDGNWSAIGADGGFIAASGGNFLIPVDLTNCVSDNNCSALADMEYTLHSSYEENRTSCQVTLVNEFSIRDECGNVAADRVVTRITIQDSEAPVVTCTDYTITLDGCPGSLGPNTPNGNWFAVGVDGGFTATSGGSFTIPVDLINCVSDNCTDLANIELTLHSSYEENRTPCQVTLVNEFSVRDECGLIATDRVITRITIQDMSPIPTITCPVLPAIDCIDVANYVPPMAPYSGACLDGFVSGTVTSTPMPLSCGGILVITYSGVDDCGRTLVPITCEVTVNAAPAPTPVSILFVASLSCADADLFVAPALPYSNNLPGDCNISGSLLPVVQNNWDACGGEIIINYSGTDICGNQLATGPFTITVEPAPLPTVTPPTFPASIQCVEAEVFVAPDAPFTNELAGTCNLSGSIIATIDNNWDACGGTITVSYSGFDDCQRPLTAGPFTINVDAAPIPTITGPAYASAISCADADNYIAPVATYTNGLTGTCNISGTLPAGVDNNWDACGGTLVLHYFGSDDCGRFISFPSITIVVQPAPIPTISLPILPSSVSCENAATYSPPSASFDNGLTGACNISGSVSAAINYFYDACGGILEITYSGTDNCSRNLVAMIDTISVDPAPAPTIDLPTYPSELTCSEAEALDGILASYDNGLQGDCEISGVIDAELIKNVTAGAGGTVTVVYSGEDDCGNILTATPIVIPVLPATMPTIQLPDDTDMLYCWDANNFTPGIATFSNGENGFCENSGELDLTTFEHFWDNCDGGYILLQYSGLDNVGNFLQSDLYKIPVLPDAFAPQGVCVDLNVKLDDIKDTPSPDELGDFQNQIASSYFETCGNVNVNIISDSGVPECGLDGTFERIYEFEITDDCGNSAGTCSVTFSGYCNPLYCTLTQGFYSSPTESFAGLSSLEMIDFLIGSGTDPIIIGEQECGFTLDDATCIQIGLTGQGQSISLPNDYLLDCGNPISNNLVNQIITATLNIRYNATLNNGGIDFGNFQLEATCMYIPQSISTELPANATVNDIINYANNFIGCQCSSTCDQYNDIMSDLTGILLGLNSRFNKCNIPGPCFLDGNPGGGIVFEPVVKEVSNGDPTSVEEFLENKDSKLEVNLYPNPAKDIINIKLNEGFGKSCLIETFDARGIKVGEKSYPSLDKDIINFDLQNYDRGIYWITIKLDDFEQVTRRFIIIK